MTPVEQHAAANEGLDTIGIVLAQGASIAPDLVMRMVVATRNRLDRHQPYRLNRYRTVCASDGQPYPCPDIRGDLEVLGVEAGVD